MTDFSNKEYWNSRWQNKATQWDIGYTSTPLIKIFDAWTDKNAKILIPGCGNAYEADYLLNKGFKNITLIDFASEVVERLKLKYINNTHIKIIQEDFFSHHGAYDLIAEQTFFCSLPLHLRNAYAVKMKELLSEKRGTLTGVLFNRSFGYNAPPFGGDTEEYFELFSRHFTQVFIEKCSFSIPERAGTEVYITVND